MTKTRPTRRNWSNFNVWDNEMRLLNVRVDILWLNLAAKMLNTNLRIYSPRWKKIGLTTKCIDPIKPIDVLIVPLSSIADGPTLKVIRVTSAVSSNAHYNLLLDAEEVDSLHYTHGVSPAGESDDTRFIMSRRGDKILPGFGNSDESEDDRRRN